jgi:ABC-type glycerol-3-phosphate transport system permease component
MSAGRVVRTVVLVVAVVAMAFPLYWAVVSSLTPEANLYQTPTLAPRGLTGEHYAALFAAQAFWRPLSNSLIVAATTTAFCVLAGSLAAYAIARLEFRGKAPLLTLMLVASLFPQITLVNPLFLLLRALHLIDTTAGLVLPYFTFAMPLAVWFLTATFRQLPLDIEHAALVDGASRLRVLWEIVLPLAWPGIATTCVLTFIYCWNEFLFALSFTTRSEHQTVPVAVAFLRGRYQIPWGQVLAATVVTSAPVVVLVTLFQRRIVGGLSAGAVK